MTSDTGIPEVSNKIDIEKKNKIMLYGWHTSYGIRPLWNGSVENTEKK